ncbi:ribosome-associated translation inhibitor RaiA [uncultured Maribacter sp.]|uniref:ribosome hibernation-promoting factor, HPF/YfiA family n=1 Tax=uncultured Maribacter sp. TaxID=431308 RepID=UPI00263622CD|nr:ribosome-associated translation inhibitor RaiA [uncultured Maribacter sp.]
MTIDIQYVQMPTSESMSNFVTEKLKKIASKYDWLIRAEVFFKLENDRSGKGKVCEIQLSAPGPRLFAKATDVKFDKAAIKTIHELEKQLSKRKEAFSHH